MQKFLGIFLIGAIFVGAGYWHYVADAVCERPVAYRIGAIDPRFDLTFEEARTVVRDAESIWEDASGQNLFTYNESADFTVSFIYDGRQEFTNAEQTFDNLLEEQREMSDEVRAEYEELIEEYEDLNDAYATQSAFYEERLAAYNAEVEGWNQEGGAPPDVYETLEERKQTLASEQRELNNIAHQLNTLIEKLNALGEEGNVIVSSYNNFVEMYNNRFGGEREFTQGDYRSDGIQIYQYEDREELLLVLAHELGHALSIGHVEGENSIMYYLMGGQSLRAGVQEADLTALADTCGTGVLRP